MIILDTNVVSELVKPKPDVAVRRWFMRQMPETLSVTTVTVFEIRFGLLRMPPSKNRQRVGTLMSGMMSEMIGTVSSFGPTAAELAADVRAMRERAGRKVGVADCMIAGIVLDLGAILATRNVKDFDGVGLSLVNPWESLS